MWALWAAGGIRNVFTTMFGNVLRARLLFLQFSKTAFFLKRVAAECKKHYEFPFFLRFYI